MDEEDPAVSKLQTHANLSLDVFEHCMTDVGQFHE